MHPIAQRSREQIGSLADIDRKVADALDARSLSALATAYQELRARSEAVEAYMASSQSACGCDVAVTNLLIIVGFAVNELDGEGRYQDWMRAESLDLLEHFPPKWEPVWRRKCDKQRIGALSTDPRRVESALRIIKALRPTAPQTPVFRRLPRA